MASVDICAASSTAPPGLEPKRGNFIIVAAGALGGIGAAPSIWPSVDALNLSGDVLDPSAVELDVGPADLGRRITGKWGGRPDFVDHRTSAGIGRARSDDKADSKDSEHDAKRVQGAEWLVLIGIRTHLRRVPLGQRLGDPHGDFDGWFGPCHGSQYNTSDRVRRGPAPKNVVLPARRFIANASIKVGWAANHSNCRQADKRPSKVRLVAIAG